MFIFNKENGVTSMNRLIKSQSIIIFIILFFQILTPLLSPVQAESEPDISWSIPIKLSLGSLDCGYPNIAISSSGRISASWIERVGYVDYMMYKYKNPNSPWSSAYNISKILGVYGQAADCSMILDQKDIVHFVWTNSLGGLYYKFLNGTNFSHGELVVDSELSSSYSLAAFSNGDVLFVWTTNNNSEINYRYYSPLLNNWSDISLIPTTGDICYDLNLNIDSADQAHLVWIEDDLDLDTTVINYLSFNNTYTFTNNTILSDNDAVYYDNPYLISDSKNNLHIVWVEFLGFPIYERTLVYKLYKDNIWYSKTYYDVYGDTNNPIICADGYDLIHLTWSEYDSILYKEIAENYQSTESEIIVDNCGLTKPAIAVSSDNSTHILYYADDEASEPSHYGVNYIYSSQIIEEISPTLEIDNNWFLVAFIAMDFVIGNYFGRKKRTIK